MCFCGWSLCSTVNNAELDLLYLAPKCTLSTEWVYVNVSTTGTNLGKSSSLQLDVYGCDTFSRWTKLSELEAEVGRTEALYAAVTEEGRVAEEEGSSLTAVRTRLEREMVQIGMATDGHRGAAVLLSYRLQPLWPPLTLKVKIFQNSSVF